MKIKMNVGILAHNFIDFEQNDIRTITICIFKGGITFDDGTSDFFMMFPDKFNLRKYFKDYNYMIKEFKL